MLGTGTYSQVFKVRRRTDGNVYALKQVKLQNLTEKEKFNSLNEVRLLASLSHTNVISYCEAFLESDTLCVIMEFADNGDLLQLIRKYQRLESYIQEGEIWKVFGQVVQGLDALHDMSILHRDIKSANVFLTTTGNAKLGDMNVSKVAKQGLLMTQTGTPIYASPEVWSDRPYGSKSDIWSLGCVVYEMAALQPPFKAEDMSQLYKKVMKGRFPPLPMHYSPQLTTMIKQMLQLNPNHRPACKRIIEQLQSSNKLDPGPSVCMRNLLLETIKFPKRIENLKELLPSPRYRSKAQKARRGQNLSYDRSCEVVLGAIDSARSVSARPLDFLSTTKDKRVITSKLPREFRLPPLRHIG